jgi:hypothetical protein
MKTRDFFDALSREHEDADGTGVGWMDWRVWTLSQR